MFLSIISLLIYIVQICIAVMIASVIPIFAFKKWRRKKVFMLLLLLCLSIELIIDHEGLPALPLPGGEFTDAGAAKIRQT